MSTLKVFDRDEIARQTGKVVRARLRLSRDSLTQELLQKSALLLDVLAISLSSLEAARELGLTTWEEIHRECGPWVESSKLLSGMGSGEFHSVFKEIHDTTPRLISSAPATGPIDPPLEELCAAATLLLDGCPIEEILRLALGAGEHRLAHRCRVSHSRLTAVLLRTSRARGGPLAVAGRAYVEGRLSIQELATILKVRIPDAVELLQSNGYVRDLDTIRLSSDHRSRILRQLRERRIGGQANLLNEDAIDREVIASSRVEGIDARSWMTR